LTSKQESLSVFGVKGLYMLGRKGADDFRLQFDPGDLPALVERYGASQDDDALEAGRQIRSGGHNRKNLEIIYRWKTKGRGISRVSRNSDEEIADALHLAVIAKTERAAVAVLAGLCGVDVPVASAILTAIDPQRYTVIDFRALEALGQRTNNRSIDFYLTYLGECRRLATEQSVALRTFDRALWQWSTEQGLSTPSQDEAQPSPLAGEGARGTRAGEGDRR
jgi:hypothetical protein